MLSSLLNFLDNRMGDPKSSAELNETGASEQINEKRLGEKVACPLDYSEINYERCLNFVCFGKGAQLLKAACTSGRQFVLEANNHQFVKTFQRGLTS